MPLDLSGIDIEGDFANQTVAIEELPTPEAKSTRGGPKETGTRTEAASGIPVLIVAKGTEMRKDPSGRTVSARTMSLYFGRKVEAGPTRRFRFDDPVLGARYFYPEAVRNVAEAGSVWTVKAVEYPEPAQS